MLHAHTFVGNCKRIQFDIINFHWTWNAKLVKRRENDWMINPMNTRRRWESSTNWRVQHDFDECLQPSAFGRPLRLSDELETCCRHSVHTDSNQFHSNNFLEKTTQKRKCVSSFYLWDKKHPNKYRIRMQNLIRRLNIKIKTTKKTT